MSWMRGSDLVTIDRAILLPSMRRADAPGSLLTTRSTPFYTLGDQLFVEPQPRALPDRLELDRQIRMSRPEVAVGAIAHRRMEKDCSWSEHEYTLVLEDDVWFRRGFAHQLDRAWSEIEADNGCATQLDILYLSYKEVKHGAQKTFLSRNVFRPVRGLWYLLDTFFRAKVLRNSSNCCLVEDP